MATGGGEGQQLLFKMRKIMEICNNCTEGESICLISNAIELGFCIGVSNWKCLPCVFIDRLLTQCSPWTTLNVANKATHSHCLGRSLIIHSIIPPFSLLTSTSQARPEWCLKGNLWAGYHKTSSVLSRTFLQFLLFSPHFSAPPPTADSAGPNHTINFQAEHPAGESTGVSIIFKIRVFYKAWFEGFEFFIGWP